MSHLESCSKTGSGDKTACETKFSPYSIQVMADSVGIANLSESAGNLISQKISERLIKLIEDAAKFMHHSKRSLLKTTDIDSALKLHRLEPVYGYVDGRDKPFRAVASVRPIYFTEEKEMELDNLIDESMESLKVPLQPSLYSYWLAKRKGDELLENIPQNPYEVLISDVIKPTPKFGNENKLNDNNSLMICHFGTNSWETVAVKNLTIDDISTEMQIYYKEITEACVGAEESKRAEALYSLSADPCILELMPRISTFIMEGVKINVVENNLALLIYLMRMVKALLENRCIYLEKYLHEIIPAVLSCIVSKRLCMRPDYDNHWALRNFASRLIAQICRTYDSQINNITNRVITILNGSFLAEEFHLSSVYGSLAALAELGNETIKTFILPRLKSISDIIDTQGYIPSGTHLVDLAAIERLKNQLSKSCGSVLKQIHEDPDDLNEYINAYGSLGKFLQQSVVNLRNPQPVVNKENKPTLIDSNANNSNNEGSVIKPEMNNSSCDKVPINLPNDQNHLLEMIPKQNQSIPVIEANDENKIVTNYRPQSQTSSNLTFQNVFAATTETFFKIPSPNPADDVANNITIVTSNGNINGIENFNENSNGSNGNDSGEENKTEEEPMEVTETMDSKPELSPDPNFSSDNWILYDDFQPFEVEVETDWN